MIKQSSGMKEMKFMHLNLSLIDIYVFLRKKIIVTNVFCKRTNKLPPAEKTIALENKQIYEHLYEE
ncbi:type II toxin-antitoxin system RelE/ParE family toxin [Treponema sp. OMZ 787]|nr:type II toxin-antitoxin system RelE/ParE family toxin [Treponema sp. OMZ 787]UTC61324.1 type II toxin-antitoxin system RelE/ParE family toxin [Treponema sp. OMZ 787]